MYFSAYFQQFNIDFSRRHDKRNQPQPLNRKPPPASTGPPRETIPEIHSWWKVTTSVLRENGGILTYDSLVENTSPSRVGKLKLQTSHNDDYLKQNSNWISPSRGKKNKLQLPLGQPWAIKCQVPCFWFPLTSYSLSPNLLADPSRN